jgi:hypothetical protein
MHACIILHIIIIYDKREGSFDENYHTVRFVVAPPVNYEAPASLTSNIQRESQMTSGMIFLHLQRDLIEHVWNKYH